MEPLNKTRGTGHSRNISSHQKDRKSTTPKPSPNTPRKSVKSGQKPRSAKKESKTIAKLRKTVSMVSVLNKLKNKKRDGTPEKSQTPNPDQASEESGPTQPKDVIINEEILKLQIKNEDLEKLREPKPPTSAKKTPMQKDILVRKRRPQSELDKPTPRIVTVARPAPPDAPIRPIDTTWGMGPRFDAQGNVIPHSILGSLEDYKKEAERRGETVNFEIPDKYKVRTPTVKYEKTKKAPKHPQYSSVDETNALMNWQKKMFERKKQQGYISKLLQKPADTLLMHHGDAYRKTQEDRYLIDRTIPSVDYGKGYRVGSEFWKQQERIGDDLTGVHMTLTQTERGYPPPIEHVGVPDLVKYEKGALWSAPATPVHYPWDKSPYLHQRKAQLQGIMGELDPHKPEINHLTIVGSSNPYTDDQEDERDEDEEEMDIMEAKEHNVDPLAAYPDTVQEPIFGPAILFNGNPARWTGDSYSFHGQTAFEARVTFEAYSGERITSFLEVVNNGTTSIYYNWKRLPKKNPFDIVNAKVQRFYFNTSSGVIMPGDTMKFPFVFKSPNAGVFTEQWQFETKPVVCGGAALVVTLRGVALQEDKFKQQRNEIEKELAHKQAEQVIRQIVSDIVEGVKTPDRARSPVDAHITREEIFSRLNPGMNFSNETVRDMNTLYQELFPEEEREDKEWDLSVANLKQMIMDMDEDDERKEEFLQRVNAGALSLSFPPFTPMQKEMHKVAYQCLLETIDGIVAQSAMIRNIMGMPEKDLDELPDGDITQKGSRPPDNRKDSKAGVKGGKDVKTPKGKEKDAGKDPKNKLGSPKKPPSRQGGPTPSSQKDVTIDDRVRTPTSTIQSPAPDSVDPVLDKKYKDKLYVQAYSLLSEMVDRMTFVFEDIRQSEDLLALAKLGLQT